MGQTQFCCKVMLCSAGRGLIKHVKKPIKCWLHAFYSVAKHLFSLINASSTHPLGVWESVCVWWGDGGGGLNNEYMNELSCRSFAFNKCYDVCMCLEHVCMVVCDQKLRMWARVILVTTSFQTCLCRHTLTHITPY